MSKSSKKEVKEVFKWTEVLRKNLVETCLEAHARGNFTDSGFKSAEWSKIEEKFNSISGEMKANRQQLQNQLAECVDHHFPSNIKIIRIAHRCWRNPCDGRSLS